MKYNITYLGRPIVVDIGYNYIAGKVAINSIDFESVWDEDECALPGCDGIEKIINYLESEFVVNEK